MCYCLCMGMLTVYCCVLWLLSDIQMPHNSHPPFDCAIETISNSWWAGLIYAWNESSTDRVIHWMEHHSVHDSWQMPRVWQVIQESAESVITTGACRWRGWSTGSQICVVWSGTRSSPNVVAVVRCFAEPSGMKGMPLLQRLKTFIDNTLWL